MARATGALLLVLLALDQALPPPLPPESLGLVVVARDGAPLRTYPSPDGVWRQPATLESVSPLYLQALLGYEDRWFHWHFGVNPVALARAGWQWLRSGRIISGGSTLTMQVARILEPPAPGQARSLRTKLRQMARAVQLELRLSKREILTLYLNHAPMGGVVEGVEMASRSYLGKPARILSHADAALLAALPQAPSRLRPDRAPRAAQAARDKVLARLAAQGTWRQAEVDDARIEAVLALPLRAHWLAPLAAERVRSQWRQSQGLRQAGRTHATAADSAKQAATQASAQAPATQPGAPGLLRTTLDTELQATVERMLLDRVGALPPKVSMAALVMDNDTLDMLAYAGSADFADNARAAHVDMVRGVRSPGSTLKPFLYALALDEGLVHAESLLVDAPQSFGGYQPGNFQASFSGPVSLAQALQKSLNVPAVDVLDRIGPAHFAAQLRAGGLRLRLPQGATPNLSLILGGAGTTLEELVGAYRALARGGLAGQPRLRPSEPHLENRLMSEGAAFIVRDILEGGGHPDRPFVEGRTPLAWKTGTSFGFRDAWAVGVTERYTVGVWVGRPDGTPNPGFFGANVAAPLLKDIVAALPADADGAVEASAPGARRRPASVSPAHTCWPLGLREDATAPEHCLVHRTGWVLNGTAPPTLPDRQRSDGLLAPRAPGCEPGLARWPVALGPWVATPSGASSGIAGLLPSPDACVGLERVGPVGSAAATAGNAATQLRITGLDHGAVLKAVPGHPQITLSLGVQGASAGQHLYWLLDGQPLPVSPGTPATALRLTLTQPGPHQLTVMDDQGRFARAAFRVDLR